MRNHLMFNRGARLLVAAVAVGFAITAQAIGDDLGSVNLTYSSLSPGLGGGQGWSVNGYNTWAGGINWNSDTIHTLCSSFDQEFGIGSSAFPTEQYFLGGASDSNANTKLVTLGDTTTVSVPDPGNPHPGESSTSFLRAAELFGEYYPGVGSSNE